MRKIRILFSVAAAIFTFACGDDITKKYYQAENEEAAVYQEIAFEPVYPEGTQPALGSPTGISSPSGEGKAIISDDGLQFKDLNGNGDVDPYEDWRLSPDERADDLVSQMTLEEKAGLLVHSTMTFSINAEHNYEVYDNPDNIDDGWSQITEKQIRFSLTRVGGFFGSAVTAEQLAHFTNSMQKLCEQSRLGIPYLFSEDPAHQYGGYVSSGYYSAWPNSLGLGATGDPENTLTFARIASREMRGVGIRMSLHPQIDTPTDPRWGRQTGCFVEGFEKTAQHAEAYVRGFQGETLSPDSNVLVCVKHFPGGGSCQGGNDAHYPQGKWAVYPGNKFEDHLVPFERAFKSGALCTMPYFSMPKNIGFEEVGMAFNWDITTGVLRDEMQFQGFVLSDWEILRDSQTGGIFPTTCNGVETLTVTEKVAKAMHAGTDQFGGWSNPGDILAALDEGLISEEDMNRSVRRILRVTMRMGLFENPYTDESASAAIFHTDETKAAVLDIMHKSIVLLKNGAVTESIFGSSTSEDWLPMNSIADDDFNGNGTIDVYYDGSVDTGSTAGNDLISNYGASPVSSPELADYVVIRANSPSQGDILGYVFSTLLLSVGGQGDLQKIQNARTAIDAAGSDAKIVVVMNNGRPTIPTEFINDIDCYLVEYSVSDEAVLDILFSSDGVKPTGRLPLEIPSSMDAANAQFEDTPADSYEPSYTLYSGLTYSD